MAPPLTFTPRSKPSAVQQHATTTTTSPQRLSPSSSSSSPQPNLVPHRASGNTRKSVLQERLSHIVVFELLAGNEPGRFRAMTLRDLFHYIHRKVQVSGDVKDSGVSQRRRSVSIGNRPPPSAGDGSPGEHHASLGGHLHPRDMRRMVTPFSPANQPALIVRRHVMLLNFDPLRAVVLRDRLLLLVPDGADEMLQMLEKSVRGGLAQKEDEVFGRKEEPPTTIPPASFGASSAFKRVLGRPSSSSPGSITTSAPPNGVGGGGNDADDDDDDDTVSSAFSDMDDAEVAFELVCLDSVLEAACVILRNDFADLAAQVNEAMDELRGHAGKDMKGGGPVGVASKIPRTRKARRNMAQSQEQLRVLKNDIAVLSSRVGGFAGALAEVLDEDEDLALMNLSKLVTNPERFRQPVPQAVLEEEGDEPELILEAYSQQALGTASSLRLLSANVASTEALVLMSLDAVRNRLLAYNTLLALLSTCLAMCTLVSGFFGMNLENKLEGSETAFVQVVMWTMVGAGTACVAFVGLFWRLGLW